VKLAQLPATDVRRIAEIDRSEHITSAYTFTDGALRTEVVDWDVPSWSRTGTGDHSVAAEIATWRPVIDRGAALIGACEGQTLLGLAIVEPEFEETLTWMAFLHVGRPHRRRGVASALWLDCEARARGTGSHAIYVSATPSASAVGFYLSRGCVPAAEPHAALYAKEPEDIHLIKDL